MGSSFVENPDGTTRGYCYNGMWYLPECAAHHKLSEPDVFPTTNGNLCCPSCRGKVDDDPKYTPPETFDFCGFIEKRKAELGLPKYCQ